MRRLGRRCMHPVGCARKNCGPGAVSQAREASYNFSFFPKVVCASSRTRTPPFVFSFCEPKKASVATLLGESHCPPRRSQFRVAIGRCESRVSFLRFSLAY